MNPVFVSKCRELDLDEGFEREHLKPVGADRIGDIGVGKNVFLKNTLVGKDNMHGVAGLGIGAIQEHINAAHVPKDKPDRFESNFCFFQITTPQEHIYILSITNGGFINFCNPGANCISTNNCIGNACQIQCFCST